MSRFNILNTKTQISKRFNVEVRVMEFKFLPIPEGVNPFTSFESDIREILQYGCKGAQAEDLIGFTYENVTHPFQRNLGCMKRFCEIDFNEIYDDFYCEGEYSDIFRLTTTISRPNNRVRDHHDIET